MKPILKLFVVTCLLHVAPSPSVGMGSIAEVDKAKAKALGIGFRSNMAGTNEVHAWIEFKLDGALKNFRHAQLEIRSGDKLGDRLLLSVTLQTERPRPDTVLVHVCADRITMPTTIVRLQVTHSERSYTLHQLRMKDFIQWTGEEIAGLSLELTDQERVEALQFKAGGAVLVTHGSKCVVTAPIHQWKLDGNRLQILSGDKLVEELTLVARDQTTLIATRRDGTLAKYKVTSK